MKALALVSLAFAMASAVAQTVPSAAAGTSAPSATSGTAPAAPPVAPVVQVAPGQAVVVQTLPPSAWTAAQTKQAFDLADSDGSGELSRAEGQRLSILPRSFEDMDANKDGSLSRAEYETGFRR